MVRKKKNTGLGLVKAVFSPRKTRRRAKEEAAAAAAAAPVDAEEEEEELVEEEAEEADEEEAAEEEADEEEADEDEAVAKDVEEEEAVAEDCEEEEAAAAAYRNLSFSSSSSSDNSLNERIAQALGRRGTKASTGLSDDEEGSASGNTISSTGQYADEDIIDLTAQLAKLSVGVSIDGEPELEFSPIDVSDIESRRRPVDVEFPPGKLYFTIGQEEDSDLIKLVSVHPRCPCFVYVQIGDTLVAINDWKCEGRRLEEIVDKFKETSRDNRVVRLGRLETLRPHAAPRPARQQPQTPPQRGGNRGGRGRGRGRAVSVPSRLVGQSIQTLREHLQSRVDAQRFLVQKVADPPSKFSHVHGSAAYEKKQAIYKAFFDWNSMTNYNQIGGTNSLPGVYMAVIEIENYEPSNKQGGPRKMAKNALLKKPKVVVSSRDDHSVVKVAEMLEEISKAAWLPGSLECADLTYSFNAVTSFEATSGDRQKVDKERNTSQAADIEEELDNDDIGAMDGEDIDESNDQHEPYFDGNTPFVRRN